MFLKAKLQTSTTKLGHLSLTKPALKDLFFIKPGRFLLPAKNTAL